MDIAFCSAAGAAARALDLTPGRAKLAAAGVAALLALTGCADDTPSSSQSQSRVEAAARQAVAGMAWRSPVVTGDFSCRGRHEYAILGTGASEIAVVVFAAEQAEPIGVLRLPLSGRDPKATVLSREDLDFAPEEFERDSGPLPEGLLPSKTCLGLSVGDGRAASAHIYWNRRAKRFATWSR
jgi:hypothetical protein